MNCCAHLLFSSNHSGACLQSLRQARSTSRSVFVAGFQGRSVKLPQGGVAKMISASGSTSIVLMSASLSHGGIVSIPSHSAGLATPVLFPQHR